MAARDYVRLVLSGVDPDQDIITVQSLLRQATPAAPVHRPLAPGPGQDGAGERLRDLALAAAGQRPPAGPAGVRRRRRARPTWSCSEGCWTARPTMPGLEIDTDLRWALLHRLVTGVRRTTRSTPSCPGQHRVRTAPRRDLPRRDPDGRSQGRGVGRGRQRQPAERHVPRDMAASRTRTRTNCSSRSRPGTSRWSATVGDGSDMAQLFTSIAYPATSSRAAGERTDAYIAEGDPPAALAGCSSRVATGCSGRCAARRATGRKRPGGGLTSACCRLFPLAAACFRLLPRPGWPGRLACSATPGWPATPARYKWLRWQPEPVPGLAA